MELTNFADARPIRLNNQGIGVAAHGDDSGLIARFFKHPHLNTAKSQAEGRPIYEDRDYIEILFPGDNKRTVCRPVRKFGKNGQPGDMERFPRQWANYQNSVQEVHEGTPLEEWGPISKSVALTFKGMNVHTVEQLASVNDAVLPNLGHGARTLRDKAVAWIAGAKDSAVLEKYAAENRQMRDEIEALKEQVAQLSTPKKPGRPRKQVENASDNH